MNMMEEGEATTRPLLLVNEIKHHDNSGQSSAHNSSDSSSSSPVTLVVVFSTFIVYCSSFAFGNVVSIVSLTQSAYKCMYYIYICNIWVVLWVGLSSKDKAAS